MCKKKIMCLGIVMVVLLILSYGKNAFHMNVGQEALSYEKFQSDSEYLVFSKMYQDKIGKSSKYGLALAVDEQGMRTGDISGIVAGDTQRFSNLNLVEYTSQYGLQGFIFSFLYNKVGVSFRTLKLLCCVLLAIVICGICYGIHRKYGKLMALSFFLVFLLSPWVVSFARNLYWVAFTWFVPVLLGLMLSINYNRKKIFVPLLFISVVIKCLCGYEYLSTVMLGTVSFFIADFFVSKGKGEKLKIFKAILIVGITCIMAFLVALVIHASIRGNGNIIDGIQEVYKNDVLRRTIIVTDKDNYTGAYRESMDATIGETVAKYYDWNCDIICGIEGKYFNMMCIGTIAILIYNMICRKKNCGRDIILFFVYLVTTLSWFVLAKSHSYIHTHINFVLWYFGYVQICLYIILKFVSNTILKIGKKVESGEEKV